MAMNGVAQTVFNCIKYEICGRTEEIVLPEVSMRFFIDLFRLSKKHDIAPIVGDALNKCGAFEHLPVDIEESEREAIAKIKTKFDEQIFTAVYRYENINNELKEIRRVLSESKIPFIPLKGSVIRKYYLEPWQRTSCDIDVLVKEKDADKASKVLAERLQYKINEKGQHDVSLFSPSNIHVELHFKLMDIEFKQVSVLRDIWNGGEITPVSGYEYRMSKELFLLYHIYHMAKHFVHGGCGIKPFIDLWIIKNKIGFDGGKAQKMLQESGLLAFYERSIDLMSVWFEGKPHNSVTQEMEDYILQGGVYGTLEQQLAMSQNKKGGKFRHLLSKIFLSYEQMKVYYPSVKKCPILFPFYQVRRWFRILFCGGRKAAMNEIKANQNLSEEKKQAAKNLIDELGL